MQNVKSLEAVFISLSGILLDFHFETLFSALV